MEESQSGPVDAPVAVDDSDPEGVLPPATRSRTAKRGTRHVIEWVLLIVGALVVAMLIKTFLFQAFYIPSESMLPTLEKNDRVLVNKLSYRLHDVNRGDIVVFEAPEDTEDDIKDLVKRVVGLPGDEISFRDDAVYVNDEPLDEGYLPDDTITTPGPCNPPETVTVPEDEYFMMGDNRDQSKDSRCFGTIPEGDIVGRVFVRIWPITRIGFM